LIRWRSGTGCIINAAFKPAIFINRLGAQASLPAGLEYSHAKSGRQRCLRSQEFTVEESMSFVHNTRLAFLLLLLSAVSALAQQADAWAAKIQRIEQMVQEEMQKNSVPGIAIAIAKDGKVGLCERLRLRRR
jgi:hypothetical protein